MIYVQARVWRGEDDKWYWGVWRGSHADKNSQYFDCPTAHAFGCSEWLAIATKDLENGIDDAYQKEKMEEVLPNI